MKHEIVTQITQDMEKEVMNVLSKFGDITPVWITFCPIVFLERVLFLLALPSFGTEWPGFLSVVAILVVCYLVIKHKQASEVSL